MKYLFGIMAALVFACGVQAQTCPNCVRQPVLSAVVHPLKTVGLLPPCLNPKCDCVGCKCVKCVCDAAVDDEHRCLNEVNARRKAEQSQLLEDVGAKLRAMMPFLNPVTHKPEDLVTTASAPTR